MLGSSCLYSEYGWHGSKRNNWTTKEQLKAQIIADCKAAKIPVSIRFGRGGWTLHMDVTIKISADEVISYDEFCNTWEPSEGMMYTESDGRLTMKEYADIMHQPPAVRADMLENCRRTDYKYQLEGLSSHGIILPMTYVERMVKPSAIHKIETVRNIVLLYNRDESDIMTDLFDRDIYDYYALKISA